MASEPVRLPVRVIYPTGDPETSGPQVIDASNRVIVPYTDHAEAIAAALNAQPGAVRRSEAVALRALLQRIVDAGPAHDEHGEECGQCYQTIEACVEALANPSAAVRRIEVEARLGRALSAIRKFDESAYPDPVDTVSLLRDLRMERDAALDALRAIDGERGR